MQNLILCSLLLGLTGITGAQPSVRLDWITVQTQVLTYHPLAKRADAFLDQAQAQLVQAKGGFDPKIYADLSGKAFKDKTYFQYKEAGFKWPLFLGIELKGNYNQASGAYLNPESTLPKAGQAAAGINWTLGQGLLLDERRYQLRQGRIGLEQFKAERQIALNDLLYDAAKAYWTWAVAANQIGIYENALQQAQTRHEALVESFRQGDKPAIDTLETYIQVQNRLLDVNFGRTDLQNAALDLRNFLWTADGIPWEPSLWPAAPDILITDSIQLPVPSPGMQAGAKPADHPQIQWYHVKQQQLDLERRWKQEKRKPIVDLSYNVLGNGWQFFPTASDDGAGVLTNNMKWGLQVSYPLLNRKARGDWQLTQVKIAQTDFGLQQKRLEIANKVQAYENEVRNMATQLALFRTMLANYRALLDAENEKFRFGESAIFLINTREQRWLDTQIKYLKLVGEYYKAQVGLQWANGQLGR